MIKVDLKFKSKKAREKLNKLDKQLERTITTALNRGAERGITIIKERSLKGKGYLGNFKKYTDEYAKFKQDRGQSTTPSLVLDNNMFRNLTRRRLSKTKFRLFFSDPDQRQKAESNQETRPFMGFTKREVNILRKEFKNYIMKRIRL